jgi:hypothetical protein
MNFENFKIQIDDEQENLPDDDGTSKSPQRSTNSTPLTKRGTMQMENKSENIPTARTGSIIIESDDEEESNLIGFLSCAASSSSAPPTKRRRVIVSSDSDDDGNLEKIKDKNETPIRSKKRKEEEKEIVRNENEDMKMELDECGPKSKEKVKPKKTFDAKAGKSFEVSESTTSFINSFVYFIHFK